MNGAVLVVDDGRIDALREDRRKSITKDGRDTKAIIVSVKPSVG